jgi:hypothetical protein
MVGVDAGRRTLRELWQMLGGRKKLVGNQIGYLVAWLIRANGGKWIDPKELNPYRDPDEQPELTEEERLWRANSAIRALETFAEVHSKHG